MNTLRFLELLAPDLAADDVGTLNNRDRLTICNAVNRALVDWFDGVPSPARTRPYVITLPPPETVSITCTNGSHTCSISPTPAATRVGSSLQIPGDPALQRLSSPTSLLMPFQGPTGTHTATLHGDGHALPQSFTNFTGPLVAECSNGTRRHLVPLGHHQHPADNITVQGVYYFWLEQMATLDGTAPSTVIRFASSPPILTRITTSYSGPPRQWVIGDLATARELDLNDRAWNLILPLTLRYLLGKPVLRQEIDAGQIRADAADAITSIKITPIPGTPGGVTIGTPPGF